MDAPCSPRLMLGGMNIEAQDDASLRRWGVLVVEDDSRARAFFEASVQRSPRLFWLGSAGTVQEALGWLSRPWLARAPALLARAPAYAIGSLAAYWCLQRAAGL